jgi:glucose-6-phosphate-specific signal transduction histidine kinase
MSDAAPDVTDIERVRRHVGRAGFFVAVAGLAAGLVCSWLDIQPAAAYLFRAALVALLLMPAKNVLAVLADEVRRRDWWFVLLAAAIVAELAAGTWDRVR